MNQHVFYNNSVTFLDENEIPMEIDDDTWDSLEGFDVKPVESVPRIRDESSPRKRDGKFQIQVLFILILAILCSYYVGIYVSSPSLGVNKETLLGNIMSDLRQNVLHQDNALRKISNHLRCLELNNCSADRVLAFIGGTGVGKTFASGIIKKYIPNAFVYSGNHVLFYDSDQRKELAESLAIDNCSFVTFDDMQLSSVSTVSDFLESLPDKCVLVVLIFNVQDTDDLETFTVNWKQSTDIVESFSRRNIFVEPVEFNGLDESVMKKWLQVQLQKWGFDESTHDAIIGDVLQNHDNKYFGFKGVHAKVKLMKR